VGGSGGNNGSITIHSSSLTSSFAILAVYRLAPGLVRRTRFFAFYQFTSG
jgi:hypothetical protein